MKYVADRGYKDLELKRHVDKGEVLEDIYKEAGVKLTKKRTEYLVEERKLYISVEEVKESEVGEIIPTDDIPEGESVIDRLDIVEDTEDKEKTEGEDSSKEDTTETEDVEEDETEETETTEEEQPEGKEEVEEKEEETKNKTSKPNEKNDKKNNKK